MNSLSIFAGLDADGVMRFVGDVPRGAACGCSCAACGSPLVAKRGEEKAWHFAHEASQERPDCLAGAINLLRRLAIEQLRGAPLLTLPPFRKVVSTRLPLPILSETIELKAQQIAVADQWSVTPPRGTAAARLKLPGGEYAAMFVEVRARNAFTLAIPQGMAAVLVEIPLPLDSGVLRDLAAAKAYLESSRQLVWKQHPTGDALVNSALKRLNERAQSFTRDRATFARWGSSEGLRRHMDLHEDQAAHGAQAKSISIAPHEVDNPRWSAWRNPKSSFIFYASREGNGWLLLQHRDGGQVLLPWPVAIDGWDEALPPSKIGAADLELGGYRVAHEVNAMVYLAQKSAGVRTFSVWSEVPRQSSE